MQIITEYYSFELPERWRDLVSVVKKSRRVDLVLLWEEDTGCSGLLASLKCLKRRISRPDEYTEFLCKLSYESGEDRYIYAAYGREGAVSEENEDLYWRLRDQLWMVFESIRKVE